MAIDLKNLKEANLEDLNRESKKLSAEVASMRSVLKAINNEISIRENLSVRVKHVENLSDDELDRVLEERTARRAKVQSISGAGGVVSEEQVTGTALR